MLGSVLVAVAGVAVAVLSCLYVWRVRRGRQVTTGGVWNELFHPTAHQAARTREERARLPEQAPSPGDPPADVYSGRIVVRARPRDDERPDAR